MTELKSFDSVNIMGIITATSNKSDDSMKSEKKGKTIYFTVDDPQQRQILIDFGLTEYTPENDEEGKPFFIVKSPEKVRFYDEHQEYETIGFSQKDPNYFTEVLVYLNIAFIKASKKGHNDFYRLTALFHPKGSSVLQETEPVNPFADLFQ